MAVNEDIEITIESEPSQFTELEVIPIYGPTGNGISRIEKTDTSYNVDTYTIYFTNGTTTTFTVTNGISILDIQKTDTTGLVDTYTISLSDGNTHTFTVTNGVGISNIAKTSTSGLVDTYTVTLNNSDSYTFTVTNGKAGTIEIGTVTTGAAGSSASVTNVGTDNEAILDFVIPKGDKGDKGDTGTAATISVGTTTTGEAGTQASVTNSGTSSAAVLNFTIPKGAKGDKGNTGDTGATGNGVSGVALQSWVGLDKTYRMSYTNGSYYDFVVSDGAAGEAEWGGISGVLSNQHDLQDALHYLKGYIENGQSYSDTTLYNDVYNYNHSTFDLSKFTVVGTPTITDGVVSGFSSSNYVKTNYSLEKGKNYKFTYSYIGHINENASGSYCLLEIPTNSPVTDDTIRMFQGTNNIIRFACGNLSDINTSITVTNNTVYNFIIETDFNTFIKVAETTTGYNHTATTTFERSVNGEYGVYFGIRTGIAAPLLLGAIDLKQFSIAVYGIPTFSGTKTGIDTIKPADYTIVGTPTISADGIVSGFSASDYLTKITTITLDKTTYFEFDIKFKTPTSWTKNGRFWAYGNKLYFGHTAGGVISGAFIGSAINQTGLSALATNTEYNIKYIYDETGFYIKYKKASETTWASSTPSAVTSNDTQTLQGAIGNAYTDSAAYFTGSIDLNSIKFYVNGNLVYQPCLLIPYNESSTGSKIVDVAYRDRVIDVYQQYGSANYYTIDETNKNVTLPMGEIYGLIGQRTLRASYRNGINYWEEYSDRTLEQGGSCTSGTTVNLLKPFADTNYVLTVPYSAKTTTSFTPSASGDWIAKGLGE